MEEVGCVGPTLIGTIITPLLYVDDIFLLGKIPYDLGKQLIILQYLYFKMGMPINTKKIKFMIIKSRKIAHDAFINENNNLDVVSSYKYLGVDIHHKLN